jgi:hypothetical protein
VAPDPKLRADVDKLREKAAHDGKALEQLIERVAALAQPEDARRFDQLTHDVRCLKYEARRAKHNSGRDAGPEGSRGASLLLRDLWQLVRSVRCLKFEVRKLKKKDKAQDENQHRDLRQGPGESTSG